VASRWMNCKASRCPACSNALHSLRDTGLRARRICFEVPGNAIPRISPGPIAIVPSQHSRINGPEEVVLIGPRIELASMLCGCYCVLTKLVNYWHDVVQAEGTDHDGAAGCRAEYQRCYIHQAGDIAARTSSTIQLIQITLTHSIDAASKVDHRIQFY
jgi:hypothetical protein